MNEEEEKQSAHKKLILHGHEAAKFIPWKSAANHHHCRLVHQSTTSHFPSLPGLVPVREIRFLPAPAVSERPLGRSSGVPRFRGRESGDVRPICSCLRQVDVAEGEYFGGIRSVPFVNDRTTRTLDADGNRLTISQESAGRFLVSISPQGKST